jgi:hypothetical protein
MVQEAEVKVGTDGIHGQTENRAYPAGSSLVEGSSRESEDESDESGGRTERMRVRK